MKQEPHPFAPARDNHPALLDPWDAALQFGPGTVMAVLTQTHGPAYRSRGAAMAFAADGRLAGALSSGCVEADLMLHARRVRDGGGPISLRYGAGSPFIDLRLPCGGAIEVALFLLLDHDVLAALAHQRAARRHVALSLSDAGRLSLGEGPGLELTFRPALRFVIFGAGPEATVFADLVHSLDHDHVLLSHEEHSLNLAERMGCRVRRLGALPDMAELTPDERCAAVLFYHDHDHEPAILRQLLAGPAFYIGAQGSRSAQSDRLKRLAVMGVPAADCTRIRGPIGLIPSARDPRLLAISVLAEVMAAAGPSISVRRTS